MWCLGVLVPFKLYDRLNEWGYLAIGLAAALPCVLLPPFLESKAERAKPLSQKYWVKANLWIAVFSFIGNYFWTHYFYQLLGASYTFPAHRLNDVSCARASCAEGPSVPAAWLTPRLAPLQVPITLYLMTHAYFCLYHALSNMLIRRVRNAAKGHGALAQAASEAAAVFVLAYATAYGETLTISHFPYYSFKDKAAMYKTGSLFYAIYFFVSFPMFFRMEEEPRGKSFSLWRVVVDALAAGMLVTCLLDFWRLGVGSITAPVAAPVRSTGGIMWFW